MAHRYVTVEGSDDAELHSLLVWMRFSWYRLVLVVYPAGLSPDNPGKAASALESGVNL